MAPKVFCNRNTLASNLPISNESVYGNWSLQAVSDSPLTFSLQCPREGLCSPHAHFLLMGSVPSPRISDLAWSVHLSEGQCTHCRTRPTTTTNEKQKTTFNSFCFFFYWNQNKQCRNNWDSNPLQKQWTSINTKQCTSETLESHMKIISVPGQMVILQCCHAVPISSMHSNQTRVLLKCLKTKAIW